LAAEARTSPRRVEGIGIGVCEIVDQTGDIVSANCLHWTSADVRRRLSSIAPVMIEADVRAAALAEARFGAGRGARVFLYVSIGTGIASCLVIDGKPFTGARGATGTMASGPLPGFNEADTKASMPSLEQVASGPALVSRFQAVHGAAQCAEDVLIAAARGNETAAKIVRSGAAALGAGIGGLVNVLDPASVVLGGGLGLNEGLYREALVESVRRHTWWHGHLEVPIVSAATGSAAGVIGAAAIAAKAQSSSSRSP